MKSIHNPCPYGNDDCPKCNMTTTPSRDECTMCDIHDNCSLHQVETNKENWEEEFKDFYYETGEFENRARGFQAYIEFIRSVLQDHNNVLIEKITEYKNMIVNTGHRWNTDSGEALDKVIEIIKHK